jgi:hypothetical protein
MLNFLRSLPRGFALASTLLLTAGAANAQSHYRGGFFISDLTPACDNGGWYTYEYGITRFRPAGVGSNSTDWHLASFFLGQYAWHILIPADAQIGEWVNAPYYGIGSRLNSGQTVAVRLIEVPEGLLWDGEAMLRMNILNFETISNCDVTVNALVGATQ